MFSKTTTMKRTQQVNKSYTLQTLSKTKEWGVNFMEDCIYEMYKDIRWTSNIVRSGQGLVDFKHLGFFEVWLDPPKKTYLKHPKTTEPQVWQNGWVERWDFRMSVCLIFEQLLGEFQAWWPDTKYQVLLINFTAWSHTSIPLDVWSRHSLHHQLLV